MKEPTATGTRIKPVSDDTAISAAAALCDAIRCVVGELTDAVMASAEVEVTVGDAEQVERLRRITYAMLGQVVFLKLRAELAGAQAAAN